MRKIVSLNGRWKFAKGDFSSNIGKMGWHKVDVPHSYNGEDGQDGGNDYYRGKATYARKFSYTPNPEECLFLEFQGVGQSADIYLNGENIAHHDGGYSTFRVEITDKVKEDNVLAVVTDNSQNDHVYPQKADFTFYGGIYRDVSLIITPKEHFELVKDGSKGVKITPRLDPNHAKATIEFVAYSNAKEVTFTIDGKTVKATSENGVSKATIEIENPHLWNGLKDPYLYAVKATLNSGDEVKVSVGIREFRVDPEKGFFLNGESYPLRGVARHQDRPHKGNAISREDHEEDLALILEMGANFIRLAHYQHADYFYDLCDKAGVITWAEIPYISKHLDNADENSLSQMKELITQEYNHPSIVCWGLSNEITVDGKITEDMVNNHKALNDLCHRMDDTRLTTMAHVFMLEKDSVMTSLSDIGAYNLYFGWYVGTLEQNEEFLDEYHTMYPTRCLGLSEYGADANPQIHNDNPDAGDYSEEYQCLYHEHLLSCIENRPYLWMTSCWNMFDFAADGRDEGGKKGINQKGLVTFDRKTKKDAFYAYKAHWSEEKFIHICGARYVDRVGNKTKVRIYSNLKEADIYLDGKKLSHIQIDKAADVEIEISKKHTIKAVSGSYEDSIVIKSVKKANKHYSLAGGKVANWFDIDPDYLSINDTFGTIMKNPDGSKIIQAMMAEMGKSRGDVASGANQNPMLMKMLAGLKLSTVLKKAGRGVTEEQIKQLNEQLQKIKK